LYYELFKLFILLYYISQRVKYVTWIIKSKLKWDNSEFCEKETNIIIGRIKNYLNKKKWIKLLNKLKIILIQKVKYKIRVI